MGLMIAILLALPQSLLSSFTEPLYPPNAQGGGAAVFAVHLNAGVVKEVAAVFAQEPFLESGREAVSQWRFDPSSSDVVLVAICYRRPEFFAVGESAQNLTASNPERGLPTVESITEPVYPPNTIAQGSVVLRVSVGSDGSVAQIKVIRDLGVLTEASVQALRGWRFQPAKDRHGMAVPSEAFAVFVFRSPLLVPAPNRAP